MGLECKTKGVGGTCRIPQQYRLNLTLLVFWGNALWCMSILHRLMKTHELQLAHKSTIAGNSILICSITHIVHHFQHSLVMAFQHCGCFVAVLLAGNVQGSVAVLGTQWGYTFTYEKHN